MKNIGILGSGFGIYGYLATLLKHKKFNIFLPIKYKKIILNRQENFDLRKVKFCKSLDQLYSKIDTIVVAKRPLDQEKIIKKIILEKKIRNYFIEKPIAINPKRALKLIKLLEENKKNFKVGFLFKYTNWYKKICLYKNVNFNITWFFQSYDLEKKIVNWKLNFDNGGGLIRFYGIHFLELLSTYDNLYFKSSTLKKKQSTIFEWELIFLINKNKGKIRVNMNSKKNFFKIKSKKYNTIMQSPFKKNIKYNKIEDIRIEYLDNHLLSKFPKNYYKNQVKIINVWNIVENITKIKYYD